MAARRNDGFETAGLSLLVVGGLIWAVALVSAITVGAPPLTILVAVAPVLIGGFVLLAADRLLARSDDR
ncbi:MAG: hypothetical protein P0Y48_11630 [Candidatus Microbacterium phytovorans]|uniref:Uncharacterized protein n=1 Tax=Candidatus Microbacterium phytovorans TaxID=3121374 RepID=A0AAJ5W184_9MICO|nr:hypothetical protein [Microbacterium sp.]WEK13109.1 MAG: hypothetical protein P0Y48_11630 [Microbacterium sp.]